MSSGQSLCCLTARWYRRHRGSYGENHRRGTCCPKIWLDIIVYSGFFNTQAIKMEISSFPAALPLVSTLPLLKYFLAFSFAQAISTSFIR